MNHLDALIRLRDEMKQWTTNNLLALKAIVDESLNNVEDLKSAQSTTRWIDKKCAAFGDSVTWYDGQAYNANTKESGIIVKGFPSYMREKLGLTVDNYGISGYTTPQICAKIKGTDISNYDMITILAGINDFRDHASEAVGEVLPIGSAFDEATFAGAYQSMVESILTRKPDIKLYIFAPFRVWYQGLEITEDYIDVIKEIGKTYGIPVLDLYSNSGYNKLTKATYIVDDLTKVAFEFHPSTLGYKQISDLIIPFLLNN